MAPDIPDHDLHLRLRAARHPYERSRLVGAVCWLALLFAVALWAAASTGPTAVLVLVLLAAAAVVTYWFLMRFWNARLLGRAVKVTPESFPELHAEITRTQRRLDYYRPINVYVADQVDGKVTITSLLGTRVLLIEGGWLADLQAEGPAPLRFLLGNFIGSLKARHGQLALLVIILDQMNWAVFIDPWMLPYRRSAEYTCDHIGYLCAEDLDASLKVLSRLTVGKELAQSVSPTGIVEQACQVADSPLAHFAEMFQAGPHMVNRYANLVTYAAEANPAEFERYRAGLTDNGRQFLGKLLTESPYYHPAAEAPRQPAAGRS
ncbi:hypothetical protein C3489_05565 [Streptomyces sp. Ru71]|uniref:M48 family metalloprotease n=1 Tax=Streptomyces sp. Ru71 TaxID=2080746 RepID=UPI000CDD4516|nr:M48 family metalloprotease [Streptomyces sp. Ru71]POX56200.1 hypothetical protein C3489_05565 [Streptomyces sp. Ru71]